MCDVHVCTLCAHAHKCIETHMHVMQKARCLTRRRPGGSFNSAAPTEGDSRIVDNLDFKAKYVKLHFDQNCASGQVAVAEVRMCSVAGDPACSFDGPPPLGA